MSIKEDEKKITILFADDHWKDNRWDALFKKKLSPYHIEVIYENQSDKVISRISENRAIKLLLLDIKFDNQDLQGADILLMVREKFPYIPVIMLTANASIPVVTEYIHKKGAYTFFTKDDPPLDCDQLALEIKNAVSHYKEKRKAHLVTKEIDEIRKHEKLVGVSKAMQELFDTLDTVALADKTSVLITGETGTGKELIARTIHNKSPRKNGPFITVNCGAIPSGLLEAELFGYLRGSFTGAMADKRGKFELAQGGTIFFDEIGELEPKLQVKLLRVLQDKMIERIGSEESISVDVRIICATNKNLEKEVSEERFREDLYYRINVLVIRTVPLRYRTDDIPALVDHIIIKLNDKLGRKVKGVVHDEVMKIFKMYSWPGNIRELENVIERAFALTMKNRDEILGSEHFDYLSQEFVPQSFDLANNNKPSLKHENKLKKILTQIKKRKLTIKKVPENYEKDTIAFFLKLNRGFAKNTASDIGISYSSLRKRMEKLNLKSMDFRK